MRRIISTAIALGIGALAHGGPAVGSQPALPATHAVLQCAAAACPAAVSGLPSGGQVQSGTASIKQSGDTTTVRQTSQDVSISWKSFNIGAGDTVDFLQPSASAIAINRITSSNGSQILGSLDANGQVWLINPNGVLFGRGAQVDVGGLVASTLAVNDPLWWNTTFNSTSLNSPSVSFSGAGAGSIVNQGTINAAAGGYVALLGKTVSNQGTISAKLGTVALGAGSAITLTFAGTGLVKLQVEESTLNALAANGGLIQADGGTVILSAGAKNALLASVVNNTGVIEARTVENHDGTIELLGGMTAGTVKVGGTLDASAPAGGNGGFIETDAAHVHVADDAKVTTLAAAGKAGDWLIDPTDFTIAASGGDETGAALGSALESGNVTVASSAGASGTSGNINVDDTVSWSANTLTLNAYNNININSPLNGSGSASLALQYGQGAANGVINGVTATYNVNAPVNLPAGPNFSTLLGSGGTAVNYTVITSLGAPTDASTAPAMMTLQGIAATSSLSGNFALGSNIDATPTSGWNSGAGFTPIGKPSTNFYGSFDGLGHTINNFTINLPSTNNVGLFGFTSTSSVIQNVGLVGGSVSGFSTVGGLVGYNGGTISNSYATGSVSGSSGAQNIGGLVGYNVGSISNSYATGSVSGSEDVGGLVGYNGGGTISNSYATGTVIGSGEVGGLVGGTFGTISSSYATGSVRGASDYSYDIGGLVGYNDGSISNSYATGSVSGASGSDEFGGLVGYNSSSGTVSNSYATGSVSGSEVGGLVGYNYGTISNSYATGSVSGSEEVGGLVGDNSSSGSVSNSYATGSVSGAGGSFEIGGLVGFSLGTISNSYATGSVSGASGSFEIGGLVGFNFGTISNSYATGSVSGASGSFYIGGLVGDAGNYGSVSNSFWDTQTTGQSSSAGGTGLTTAQMQSASSFTGWSISATGGSGDVWRIYQGNTYPLLTSFLTPLTVSAADATVTYSGSAQNGASIGTPISGVFGSAATGTNAGFYNGYYSNQQGYDITGGNLTINPAALTLSGTRVYDGTTVVAGSVLTATGVAGQTFSVTGVGDASNLSSKDVQTGSSLSSLLGLALGTSSNGGLASNYTALSTTGSSISITPLALTGASIAAANSTYGSAVTPGAVSFGNVVGNDVVGATASIVSPSYSTSHNLAAGSYAQTATTLSGADAGDYSFAGFTTPSSTYTVNPLALTGAAIASGSSTYGSAVAPGAVSFGNVVGGDLVSATASIVSPSYSTSHNLAAGSYAQTATTLSGADAGDYSFAGFTTPSSTYTVNPLALTGAAIASGSSTYGSAVAPGAVSFSNVVGGDQVSATASIVSPSYSTSHNLAAGSYAQTATTLSGADAGDYSFAGFTTPSNNYTVGKLALTGAAIAAANSTYGSAVAPGAVSFGNVVGGDLVSATASIVSPTYSTSHNLAAGSYAQTASALTGADAGDYSFAGFTTVSDNYTVGKLALTGASIAAVTSTYGTPEAAGAVTLNGVIKGDKVSSTASIVKPVDSGSGNLDAGSYAQTASLSGADARDYTFTGGVSSYTTPTANYTVGRRNLPVTGVVATNKVYNGSAVDPLGGEAAIAPLTGDKVTLSGSGVGAFASPNVGTAQAVSVTGYSLSGADAGNYTLWEPTGLAAAITQLSSVTWVGGASGVWSKASNWAGGAIPDYGNVANVSIPSGATVTYDSGVPGSTTLSTLASSGTLVVAAGKLSTSGNLSTAGYEQIGGILDVGGSLTIHSVSGGVTLGNISAGSMSVSSLGGAITQLASTTIDVVGASNLTADNGLGGQCAVAYNITLAQTADSFWGAVSSTGHNIDLLDGSSGGLILGNTNASGSLSATARAGALTQAASTAIDVTGTTSLAADNGVSGKGAVDYAVTLAQSADKLQGAVTAQGSTITLDDAAALTAILDSTGAVSLDAAGALVVAGTVGTSLTTVTSGGAHSTTTFDATAVGSSLKVTSTGAVTTATTSTVLTVDGAGTKTPNSHVTVNGVTGAEIK